MHSDSIFRPIHRLIPIRNFDRFKLADYTPVFATRTVGRHANPVTAVIPIQFVRTTPPKYIDRTMNQMTLKGADGFFANGNSTMICNKQSAKTCPSFAKRAANAVYRLLSCRRPERPPHETAVC